MANIEKRTDKNGNLTYRVKVRLKGYPVQSASFDRLTDARKWAASTESAIREGRHFPSNVTKRKTLEDAIERYLNGITNPSKHFDGHNRLHLERWRDEIGYLTLSEVTSDKIAEIRDKLLTETTPRGARRSPSTVNRYLSSLSPVFTLAVNEWGWMDDTPLRKLKKPKESRGRVRFLDDDERSRLLQACQDSQNEILYLCVILALSTGMRQGELMGLKWVDVDLKSGYAILHETKNGERRRVPLTGHALELLKQHAKIRRLDSPLLFPSTTDPLKPIELKKPWQTALKRAGIDNFRWHDLRHCTASYLAMNGASLAEIAEVLGHKTLQMVKRYSHLSDGHVSSVVESMNAKLFG